MPDSASSHIFVTGLSVTIKKLQAMSESSSKYAASILMRCVQQDFMPKWDDHINLQDHSLEDLRKLGHPYSNRYAINSFVHPDSFVHEQSGDLLNSFEIRQSTEGENPVVEMISTSETYKYIRFGTSTMRIRDPASEAIKESIPAIKDRWENEMKGAIVEIAIKTT